MFDKDGIVKVKLPLKSEKYRRFVNSFYSATIILLKSAIYTDFLNPKHTNDLDEDEFTLIYAIMFNYRHFIEVAIKSSIESLNGEVKRTHTVFDKYKQLNNLWVDKTKKLDKNFWLDKNFDNSIDIDKQFKYFENIVRNIDAYDNKNATSFRYPQEKRAEVKLCLNEIETNTIAFMEFYDNLSWAIRILKEST